VFRDIVASEVLSVLGHERFERGRSNMDRTVVGRIAAGYDVTGLQYLRAKRRQQELECNAREAIAHVDAVITPVNTMTAPPADDYEVPEKENELAIAITRCTQPMNIYNMCGATLPVQHLSGGGLPIGVQVMGAAGTDRRMLSLVSAVEGSIGAASIADLSALHDA
jgi:aspartyl-tRNA(Asn)/glutamyl-tRNA(Gln) amidotransferase subunit A